jgi:uncharacterized membrane protein
VPFFGMALGATMGALGGHFADHGINDDFIKQVRAKVTEGTSGLFLLLGVVEAFKSAPYFELIASNLTP